MHTDARRATQTTLHHVTSVAVGCVYALCADDAAE